MTAFSTNLDETMVSSLPSSERLFAVIYSILSDSLAGNEAALASWDGILGRPVVLFSNTLDV